MKPYDSLDYFSSRMSGTYVVHNKEWYYVSDYVGDNLFHLNNKKSSLRVDYRDINPTIPLLGFGGYKKSVCYLSRLPTREYKQGLTKRNTKILFCKHGHWRAGSFSNLFPYMDNMLNEEFVKVSDALEKIETKQIEGWDNPTSSFVLSRNFALTLNYKPNSTPPIEKSVREHAVLTNTTSPPNPYRQRQEEGYRKKYKLEKPKDYVEFDEEQPYTWSFNGTIIWYKSFRVGEVDLSNGEVSFLPSHKHLTEAFERSVNV